MKTFGWRNEEGYILQLYMFKGGSSLLEFPMGSKTLANGNLNKLDWTRAHNIMYSTWLWFLDCQVVEGASCVVLYLGMFSHQQ